MTFNNKISSFSAFFRKVHITKQTLDMLNGQYPYDKGTEKARNDPLLLANGIQTYLITPNMVEISNNVSESYTTKIYLQTIIIIFFFLQTVLSAR